jgi:antirestriction protein ArdC
MARTSRKSNKSRAERVAAQRQEVVDGIVAALEKGVAPWNKPFAGASLPYNACSGSPANHYNGINIWILWAASIVKGYAHPGWVTFDQAMKMNGYEAEWVERTFNKKNGGTWTKKVREWKWAGKGAEPQGKAGVRKGEKSTAIIYAGTGHREETDEETGEVTDRYWRTFKVWRVFNVEQIDWHPGCKPQTASTTVDPEAGYEAAAALFNSLPADVRHGGGTAAYSPKGDFIILPEAGNFASVADYWSTRAHETVHWTGHKNRCDRPLNTAFGSEAYAFEELVAELGSAFLCTELGIEGKLQHAEYIGSWIKVLKSDTKALFDAARQAHKACDWVKGDNLSQAASAASA